MRHDCSNRTDYQPIQNQKHYTGIIIKTKNKTAHKHRETIIQEPNTELRYS